MFKRVVLVVVLTLALPLVVFASSSIDIANAGGVISGNSSGLFLTGSALFSVAGIVGSNLGSLSFTTGAFTSGGAQIVGTLAAGGTF